MATFFLVIIYLAFISLGLPDSLLGAAWPVMQPDLGAPLETAGLLFMTIAGGTIISSLASRAILTRFGTGNVTFVSVLMTAGSLLGFYFAPSLVWLFICAIPLGLGAGSVDAGLNNYVALHYKAHHMSWLHCFWGVGATLGPIIMAYFMSGQGSWRNGYFTIASIQFALAIILFFTLPLWKKTESKGNAAATEEQEAQEYASHDADSKKVKSIQITGVKLALASFLFYCSAEATIGLWGSSFLVNVKELSAEVSAQVISLFYAGITIGRFISGFITLKVSNKTVIRIGQLIALAGMVLLLLPLQSSTAFVSFTIIGLGMAPIFPSMLHETPARFGKEHSQAIIGYQMAFASAGTTFMPPVFGFLASYLTIGIFPFFIVAIVAAMILVSEKLNRFLMKKDNFLQTNNPISTEN
ncbi:MFS transporter [Virgibacillus phasianinus]|uniref:MFS transporter n=1 Tax=Virgibacillus phasianinus TaxID=2017483 RepID=A0A220U2P6_9BACI|nr:MFS transporter [Virgibacillus phasianinus]ASK62347.1 MFS transporter [Virgibacillus phasianinus]